MPLKVIVVGAGIGGLCAAISLRQAGHIVEVGSKSMQGFLSLLVVVESSGLPVHHSTLKIRRERMMLALIELAVI